MTRTFAVVFAAFALLFTRTGAPASTQETRPTQAASPATATVATPLKFKVGDVWTYSGANGEYLWRIKEVSADAVLAENSTGRTYRFSPDGNLLQGYSGNGREVNFRPSTKDIKFPLREGTSWDETYSGTGTVTGRKRGDERPKTWEFRAQGRVLGLEEVTVPAGTFKAWKIDHRLKGGDTDEVRKTCWYAEEVKRFVKCTSETHPAWNFVLVKSVLQK